MVPGGWTVRWLMLALAITPFARIVDWPRLLTVRRMVGVTATAYALAHFSLYVVDQKFHLLTVASEIALRFYLAIGFVALCGLIALGVTSTVAMMKRMGKRWKQLHRLVYPIGVLALLHFFIQTKANVGEPVFVSGLFVWLMLWRHLLGTQQTALWIFYALVPGKRGAHPARRWRPRGMASLTKIDPFRILSANWNERFFPRPAHEVAMAALAVAIVVTVRRMLSQRSTPRPTGGGCSPKRTRPDRAGQHRRKKFRSFLTALIIPSKVRGRPKKKSLNTVSQVTARPERGFYGSARVRDIATLIPGVNQHMRNFLLRQSSIRRRNHGHFKASACLEPKIADWSIGFHSMGRQRPGVACGGSNWPSQ